MTVTLSTLSDHELMARICDGNHAAFTDLVTRHTGMFFRLAYRTLHNRDEAEDIVQQAFIKLWQKPERWDPTRQTKFTTWFYKVVVNLCLDHRKKRKPLPLAEGYEMEDKRPLADAELEATEQQLLLESWIAELPERQQLALNLCFYEGIANKDAADIMDINIKALESLLMRAKKSLKDKAELLRNKEAA